MTHNHDSSEFVYDSQDNSSVSMQNFAFCGNTEVVAVCVRFLLNTGLVPILQAMWM
jgi:hypothetical protein